jgi:hypothetical protein
MIIQMPADDVVHFGILMHYTLRVLKIFVTRWYTKLKCQVTCIMIYRILQTQGNNSHDRHIFQFPKIYVNMSRYYFLTIISTEILKTLLHLLVKVKLTLQQAVEAHRGCETWCFKRKRWYVRRSSITGKQGRKVRRWDAFHGTMFTPRF